MRGYGIKTPEGDIHWISEDDSTSWRLFFQYPNERKLEANFYRLPMFTAKKAYQAIGYNCVELKIEEI